MRIESAIIGMDSARSYSSRTEQSRSVRFTLMGAGNEVKTTDNVNETKEDNQISNELTDNLVDIQNRYQEMVTRTSRLSERSVKETFFSIKHQCFQYLFQCLFGYNVGHDSMNGEGDGMADTDGTGGLTDSRYYKLTDLRQSNMISLNVESRESLYFEEHESTGFETTGTVKCADGREISFNLSLEMSRSFAAYYENTRVENAVQFCDPLVINLDNNIAELSDQKFYFDLDADGVEEYISKLGKGSGYLALDKNEDGKIGDGSELFGTKSGDGFADLMIYDEDGNGWIDENDAIWDKLKIWTTDENGKDILYTLKESGVGAICLQRAATDFSMTDDYNETKGAIRSTGIFLYENGGVGTMQHLDIAR